MKTHKKQATFTLATGFVLPTVQVTYQSGAVNEIEESIPNGATDLAVTFAIVLAKVTSFIVMATKAMTLKTNNAGAPANTIALVANKPYSWDADSYDDFQLTVDVTGLFITNASGEAGDLYVSAIYDPT